MNVAVYSGSFDPFTLGHEDIVRRALTIFDKVIIGIAVNNSKKSLFTIDERISLANELFMQYDGRVEVRQVPGLLAEFANEVGANAIIRGLRGGKDFDAEAPMAVLNRQLSGLETVFIFGDPALSHISSSAVKELDSYGADISQLVSPAIAAALAAKK